MCRQGASASNPSSAAAASASGKKSKRSDGTNPFDVVDKIISGGIGRGLLQLSTEDAELHGRCVTVRNGHSMVNFSSCSFLGLETHPDLVAGVEGAVRKFGTQFSSSRSYVQIGLYDELEAALGEIMGGMPTIATGSTSLAHLAALPALVDPSDAIILDQHVHASVQMAANYLRLSGVRVETLRHNRMDALSDRIQELRGVHNRIWYMADGVYSMSGIVAPLERMCELADAHPELRLYVDDAHGFSWAGTRGRGHALETIGQLHPQMILVVSLNKSFASGGGAIVFPNDELRRRVRNVGPTLMFGGPIQPPMLGAAIASARLHLSDEFPGLQAELMSKIAYANECCRSLRIPLADTNDTPIFFVPVGTPELVYGMGEALLKDGCLVNWAVFPAVPFEKGGVRFVITRHQSRKDIRWLTSCVAKHLNEGCPVSLSSSLNVLKNNTLPLDDVQPLKIEVQKTIHQLNCMEWDKLFEGRGSMNRNTQALFERAFQGNSKMGQDFQWRYVLVMDKAMTIVAATYFSIGEIKEDMFAAARISEELEERRMRDPSYLVSRAVVMGSPLSLGEHLYLDRRHVQHKAALKMVVETAHRIKEECHAEMVLFRDFSTSNSLADTIPSLGFVELQLPDHSILEPLGWADEEAYLSSIASAKKRKMIRNDILRYSSLFDVVVGGTTDRNVVAECYRLYRMVHARGRAINTFPLPESLFREAFKDRDFDVVRLYHVNANGRQGMASFVLSHFRSQVYSALVVGVDDALFPDRTLSPYKQILYQTVQRANRLGARRLDLGFTADQEKKRLGALPMQVRSFRCADDDSAMKVMANL